MDSIPGLGRSLRGGHGNPLQCSCLENSMDRGAWWATVHEVSMNQTQLSSHTHTRGGRDSYHCLWLPLPRRSKYSKKAANCKPKRGPLPDTEHSRTLTLDFPASKTMRNCCCLSHQFMVFCYNNMNELRYQSSIIPDVSVRLLLDKISI